MGRQSQLMWVGIAGFWFCGVPLGYTLAFPTHFGLSGLWLGSLTGALIVCKSASSSDSSYVLCVCWMCISDTCIMQHGLLAVTCCVTIMSGCWCLHACSDACTLWPTIAPYAHAHAHNSCLLHLVPVAACWQALLALQQRPSCKLCWNRNCCML